MLSSTTTPNSPNFPPRQRSQPLSQVTAATAATLSSITAVSLKQAVQAAVQVALGPTQQAFAALQLEVSSMREIIEAHAKTQVLHAQILANLTQSFPSSQQLPYARPHLPAPPQPMSNQPTFQETLLPPDLRTIPPAPASTEPVSAATPAAPSFGGGSAPTPSGPTLWMNGTVGGGHISPDHPPHPSATGTGSASGI